MADKPGLSIGDRVQIGKFTYEVSGIKPLDPQLTFVYDEFKKTGKDPFFYSMSKISPSTGKKLKSGGGIYLRFSASGNMIKY